MRDLDTRRTEEPHSLMVGQGITKVSWRVASSFGLWHRIRHQGGTAIETWCGISVPGLQDSGRNFTYDATPYVGTCAQCFPRPEPQADGTPE